MPDISDAPLAACKLEKVWRFWVELGPEDGPEICEAINEVARLRYGAYDNVAFLSAEGIQTFRGNDGSVMGRMENATERHARALTFSIDRDPTKLSQIIETIQAIHSYEEPVVYVTEAYATRANYSQKSGSLNRWWNQSSRC